MTGEYHKQLFIEQRLEGRPVGSWGSRGRPAVGLGLGSWRELSGALVGNVGVVSALTIDRVGHLLEASIGEGNVVRSGRLFTVPVLVLSVVVVGGVILHLPVEVVDSGTGFRLAVGRS